jgi:hypothetical protein
MVAEIVVRFGMPLGMPDWDQSMRREEGIISAKDMKRKQRINAKVRGVDFMDELDWVLTVCHRLLPDALCIYYTIKEC